MSFVVVYDANVLYPAELRDFLIRLAGAGLFQAKWTDRILDETFDAILGNRPELGERLRRTREKMNRAVPDVLVEGYESLIAGIRLPDPDDRHVLAAAIRSHAQVIVTFNLRDFPQSRLDLYDIEAQDPDDFAMHVFDLDPSKVVAVLKNQSADLVAPEISFEELLARLERTGLRQLVATVRHQGG